MSKLTDIFTDEVIRNLKENKDQITHELLETLRSYGDEGKELALTILDTAKSQDNYYIDAFNEKISYNGDRDLKKAYTQMKLSAIHVDEIKRCSEDLYYFKDNYIKIRTNKGIGFPELRTYQKEFLDFALDDDSEGIVSLAGRQCGKSITTAIYLTWKFNFCENMNIGICANKAKLAREFLNNVKMIFSFLPMWMRVGVTVWNKSDIASESNMRILTDAPSENSFRGFTCAILVVDECAWISANKYNEFADSVFPSQSALSWKKNILLSTPNGLNHFKTICDKAKDGSSGYKFHFVDWKIVPRFDSKGNQLSAEQFKDQIVRKNGEVFFAQNYACSFIGSSYTLVDANVLRDLHAKECELFLDNKLQVYEEPQQDHKYIMSVDPAKGGLDAFAIQIIDVTNKPFIQVASAQLFKYNFQKMPVFLDEWGKRFNNAFMIIENNEGAGTFCASMLQNDYEYQNLYYEKTNSTKTSKLAGFRTTSKSRKQILDTLKLFLDNKLLIINNKETIDEFYTFIVKNDKYQADDGCHDDMVMSLALAFAPFCNTRNFEDMSKLINDLYDENVTKVDFSDYLAVGNFDSIEDDNYGDYDSYNGFDSYF